MSLTKLFNFDYMFENIKKSKMQILICMLVVPLFTTIMLLTAESETYNFTSLGIFNILFMYVIPFILSVNLFGYIYKKRSVDFIGSMPLSRKTIFFTNTLAGILIILGIQALTLLCTLIVSTFSSSIIFAELAWDVFVYQTFAYIFLFTIANLAMSVSGNMMTQIVGILLITLLVPALYTFTYFATEDNAYTTIYENTTISPISHFDSFTAPTLILSAIDGHGYGFNVVSMTKMILLSVIYIALGYLLFKRRKMEKAGESFVKKSSHYLIKALTLIPFVMMIKAMFMVEEFEALPFVLGITLVYWFVYDLITSKKMKFLQNSLALVVSIVVIYGVLSALIGIHTSIWNGKIKTENIAKLELYPEYYSSRSNDFNEKCVIKDAELIRSIVENNKAYEGVENSKYLPTYMNGTVFMKNGRKYHIAVMVDAEDREKVLEYAEKQIELPFNKNVKVHLSSQIASIADRKELNEIIKNLKPYQVRENGGFDSYFITYDSPSSFEMYRNGFYQEVYAYEYVNHKLYMYIYSELDNPEIGEFLTNLYNKVALEQVRNAKTNEIYYTVRDAKKSYGTYSSLDVKSVLRDFILDNKDEKVDLNQDFIRLKLTFRKPGTTALTCTYTTNKVQEVIEKFTVSQNEVGRSEFEEYNEYFDDYDYYFEDGEMIYEVPNPNIKVLNDEEINSGLEENLDKIYTEQ